jgi:hypothetical protein
MLLRRDKEAEIVDKTALQKKLTVFWFRSRVVDEDSLTQFPLSDSVVAQH